MGPRVSNVAPWEQLAVKLDKPGRTVEWVKLPSHVGTEGNAQADLLANVLTLFIPYNNMVSNAVSKEGNPLPRGGRLTVNLPLTRLVPSLHTTQQLLCSPWVLRSRTNALLD